MAGGKSVVMGNWPCGAGKSFGLKRKLPGGEISDSANLIARDLFRGEHVSVRKA